MMAQEHAAGYRRLRAPRANGATVVDPPFSAIGDVLAENERRAAGAEYDVQGRSLRELADQARAELVAAAVDYTRRYRDVPELPDTGRILLAGHQPELFHPGVWFKNFALSHLAREHQSVGINLLIDSDKVKRTALRVPGGSVESPEVRWITYDAPGDPVPHEERRVLDPAQMASFVPRVTAQLGPFVAEPLLEQLWPLVLEHTRSGALLGESLAAGRHQWEGRWGCRTLELPQSRVCSTEPFYWFAAHLLAWLPKFWDVYNSALAEFRRVNKLRSATHPVPDLASDDDWLEAPFWVWSASAPRRRRLFARPRGDEVLLTDRNGWRAVLPLHAEGEAARAADALASLARQGVKLRTRALSTTLWARLALGDLFLHGIGGGKYDQLTDLLIARFFGLEPPEYMTLSATLQLPVPRHAPPPDALREIDRQLRDMEFHPERHLPELAVGTDDAQRVGELLARKQQWIAAANGRQRYLGIRETNAALQPWLELPRSRLLEQRAVTLHRLRAESILASREYAFCLFPEASLRGFMLAIPANTP